MSPLEVGIPEAGIPVVNCLGDDERLSQWVLNASIRTSGQTWVFGHGDAGPAV